MNPPLQGLQDAYDPIEDVPASPETEAYFAKNIPNWQTMPAITRNLARYGEERPDPTDPNSNAYQGPR